MKTIVAGSRSITSLSIVSKAIGGFIRNMGLDITQVVSGGARGVDQLAEEWARRNDIPVAVFPASWKEYGKSAGPLRNIEMAEYADALIAIWDGRSRGTANMIQVAELNGLRVFVHVIN